MRISTAELAKILGMTKQSATALLRSGSFKTAEKEKGFKWTVDKEEVYEYLDTHSQHQQRFLDLMVFFTNCVKRIDEIEKGFLLAETQEQVIQSFKDTELFEKAIEKLREYNDQIKELQQMRTAISFILRTGQEIDKKLKTDFVLKVNTRIDNLELRMLCYLSYFDSIIKTLSKQSI